MARPIWTGALSFGLVNVPVGVYSATDDKTVHFNQLQRDTSDRVRMKRVNERTGDEVPYDEIVKGVLTATSRDGEGHGARCDAGTGRIRRHAPL